MLLEYAGWERFPLWAAQEAFASKVKQQRVVVVELVKHGAFFLRHQPIPNKKKRGETTYILANI